MAKFYRIQKLEKGQALEGLILPSSRSQENMLKKMEQAFEHLNPNEQSAKAGMALNDITESQISYSFVLKSINVELRKIARECEPAEFENTRFARNNNPEKAQELYLRHEDRKTFMREILDIADSALKRTLPDLQRLEYPLPEEQTTNSNPETTKPVANKTKELSEEEQRIKQLKKIHGRFMNALAERHNTDPATDFTVSADMSRNLMILRLALERIIQTQENPRTQVSIDNNGANTAILKEFAALLEAKTGFTRQDLDAALSGEMTEFQAQANPVPYRPIMVQKYSKMLTLNNHLAGDIKPRRTQNSEDDNPLLSPIKSFSHEKRLQNLVDECAHMGVSVVAVPYPIEYVHLDEEEAKLRTLKLNADVNYSKSPVNRAFAEFRNASGNDAESKRQAYDNIKAAAEQSVTDELKRQEEMLDANDGYLRKIQQKREEENLVNQTMTLVLNANWEGLIRIPEEQHLTAELRDFLANRHKIAPIEKQSGEQYQARLQENKIWQICRLSPAFAAQEEKIINGLVALQLPPEQVNKLQYADLTYMMAASNRQAYADDLRKRVDTLRQFAEYHERAITSILLKKGKKRRDVAYFIKDLKSDCITPYHLSILKKINDINKDKLDFIIRNDKEKLAKIHHVESDIRIPSERRQAAKNFAAEHSEEFAAGLREEGKSEEYIAEALDLLRAGKCPRGYSLHHPKEKSDAMLSEKMLKIEHQYMLTQMRQQMQAENPTQAADEIEKILQEKYPEPNYTQINKKAVLVKDEEHLLMFHLHENFVNESGFSTFNFASMGSQFADEEENSDAGEQKRGSSISHRTVYVTQDGQAYYLVMMPQESIDGIISSGHFLFNHNTLAEAIKNKKDDMARFDNEHDYRSDNPILTEENITRAIAVKPREEPVVVEVKEMAAEKENTPAPLSAESLASIERIKKKEEEVSAAQEISIQPQKKAPILRQQNRGKPTQFTHLGAKRGGRGDSKKRFG